MASVEEVRNGERLRSPASTGRLQRVAGEGDRETPDRDLVLAFQNGDGSAFAAIDRRYRRYVRRLCLRFLENREDAEEATQETMLRVFKGLPSFNGQYALKAWIGRIATNLCYDVLRARSRTGNGRLEVPLPEDDADELADPSDPVESLAQTQEIQAALARMPDKHRTALTLREVEGRSHAEIGAALGISGPQAKALLHRAKRYFRRAWVGEGSAPVRLLLLPFLGLSRVAEAIRRLLSANVNPAAAASLTPALASTAPASEQVATAVAALVVAAGVGAGGPSTPPRPEPASPDRARAATHQGRPFSTPAGRTSSPSRRAHGRYPPALRPDLLFDWMGTPGKDTPRATAPRTEPAAAPAAGETQPAAHATPSPAPAEVAPGPASSGRPREQPRASAEPAPPEPGAEAEVVEPEEPAGAHHGRGHANGRGRSRGQSDEKPGRRRSDEKAADARAAAEDAEPPLS